jgi:hypothetical protein
MDGLYVNGLLGEQVLRDQASVCDHDKISVFIKCQSSGWDYIQSSMIRVRLRVLLEPGLNVCGPQSGLKVPRPRA